MKFGDPRVGDVHRFAVGADADAVWLAESVFDDAESAGGGSETVCIGCVDRILGNVDGVAVPGVSEENVTNAVDKEVVGTVELGAVVVVY